MDEDAPKPVAANVEFENDDQLIQTIYFFAERFGWTPRETMDQDETILNDLLLFDRQAGYRKWATRHDIDDDEDESAPVGFGPEVLDWKVAFGVAETS